MAMPTERYEILILGSGFGGKLLAWDMAGAGHRTAVVERRSVGGTGRFVAPKTVEVRLNDGGTRVVAGDRVFLNVGTHATMPAIPGLADSRPLTNIELLELDRVPEHLVVLGGGYVGLEFAQAYRR